MSEPTARVLAVQRLLRVERDGAHVARLTDPGVAPEVSRLAVDLVSGVTRWRRWLDFVVGQFYRGRVEDLDPELLQVLRIGAYDLLVRETASHAAVNEAVETAKAVLHRGAAGLTNGVLRALDRARRHRAVPEPASGDRADDLAVRFSHPTWAVRRWLAQWGEDATRDFLVASNDPGRYTLRLTGGAAAVPAALADLGALGVEGQPVEDVPDFVAVSRLQPVLRAGWIAEGRCAVQDVAAGLVVRVLDPQPGETILDGAAAPGGKAVYAALRMGDRGEVVALDVSEAKAALVRRSARRQGAETVRAVVGDLTAFEGQFDRVLLDAPCSGSGVLAKRADLRWRRSPDEIDRLTTLQDSLLDAAAQRVRPGGLMVYATCSVEPEENDRARRGLLGARARVRPRAHRRRRARALPRRRGVSCAPPRPRHRRRLRRSTPQTHMTDLRAPYLDAQARLAALTDGLSADAFNRKPTEKGWSAGECVVHLNKMAKGYLPVLEVAASRTEPRAEGPFQYGFFARKFVDAVRPGARPIPTAGSMKPPATSGSRSDVDMARAVERFDADVDRYLAVIDAAEGLDLAAIKVRSPFLPVLRFPLGVFLEAMGLHAVRHVMQAERAVAAAHIST